MPLRLLIALLLSFSLPAAAATVRAYVQPGTAQTNQIVNYVITVQNGQLQTVPQLRLPAQIGMNSALQQSQSINMQGGRTTMSLNLSWQIAGTEPGEYTIPPQDLLIDGQIVKTNEVKFIVTEAPANPAAPMSSPRLASSGSTSTSQHPAGHQSSRCSVLGDIPSRSSTEFGTCSPSLQDLL